MSSSNPARRLTGRFSTRRIWLAVVTAALVGLFAVMTGTGTGASLEPACTGLNAINGTVGSDTLSGTAARDYIRGLDGNDTINGLSTSESDCLFGNAGNDAITGGDGADLIQGGIGNDHIDGGSGDDTINGDDLAIEDSGGNDVINGGPGGDLIEGQGGNDVINGGAGADNIGGGSGVNRINGGAGNDTISSRNGRKETVRCGAGKDKLRADKFDKAIGCEKVIRQPSAFPAASPAVGTTSTTFKVRWEVLEPTMGSMYTVNITTPCGPLTYTSWNYGSAGSASTISVTPHRAGQKVSRWCAGNFRGSVVQSDGTTGAVESLVGTFSFKVHG